MKKTLLMCGVILATTLVSVVHCDGGQSNYGTRTIKETPIKEEVIIGIGEFPTENDKLVVVNGVGDTFGISCEVDKYTNTTVNLRADKSTDSQILTTLQPNIMVTQYYIYKDWAYVRLEEDAYGYIKTEYLSLNETPISELNRWGIDLTDEEIDLLCAVLEEEANTEPYKGKVAVVETVFNRMINGSWGNTLYEVVSAPNQFLGYDTIHTSELIAINYEVIYDVLYGKTNVLPMNYLYFSRGGHMAHGGVIVIGDHQFCTKG